MEIKLAKDTEKDEYYLKEKIIEEILSKADSLNSYYNENFDFSNRLITKNDLKILHFIFLLTFKSLKFKDYEIFFNLKKKIIIDKKNNINNNLLQNTSILIQKFINICLINSIKLSPYFGLSNHYFVQNIFKISKILFLNNYLDENNFKKMLNLQIILCLYKENKKNKDIIQNIEYLYLIIDFLLSFCSNNNYFMKDNKFEEFNNVVSNVIDIINQHILENSNNKIILSNNKKFYNLIKLSQIVSDRVTSKIIKSLISVYVHKLNIDFIFDDLSEQFLYKRKKESISNKTNVLIAKNIFLNELFEKEKKSLKEEEIFIKNGFYFNDYGNTGIICDPINNFNQENDGYSIVLSFRLVDENKKINKDKSIYTIFSLSNKENNKESNLMHVYIEDYKIKIKTKKEKKVYELYEISSNSNYVLWIIQKRKESKRKMILFLNNTKNILNNAYYPKGSYKINLGFDNNNEISSKNNFVGIIGSFILFKKCLIKDENDFSNITKLLELKGNYEDIIYSKTRKEWAFAEKSIYLILNKISNDIDIYKDIDIIISTKSLGLYSYFNNLNELKNNKYNCNYFKNDFSENQPKFSFRNNINKNNLNYTIQLNNTIFNFLNNHGFLYLQLELYYFINILCSELNEGKNNNNKTIIKLNEQQNVYLNISRISSLFFFCLDSLNSNIFINNSQYNFIKKEIDNFKYTLIDLISLYSKYDCKIKTYFLSLFVQKISEKRYFEYCLFILTFEFYEVNDNEAFDVLFNYLNNISIDDCDKSQTIRLFTKLLDFDIIYLSEKIKKNTKKEYSKLMKYLIKKSINEQIEDNLNSYKLKVINLKEEFLNNNLINDGIQEEEINNENDGRSNRVSSDDNNENNRKSSRASSKISGNKIGNGNINNKRKNIDLLKLIYKYLKNLYIAINDIKKKFIESSTEIKDNFCEFLNDLFNKLCIIYHIQKDEENTVSLSANIEKEEIIIAELIKSICIRFLDDLFFEDNIKLLNEESKKQKDEDNFQEENENKKGSSGNLKTSFNSCKASLRSSLRDNNWPSFKKNDSSILNNLNNSPQNSFISTSFAPLSIEGILTSKMKFFDQIILSPYTFKSLFFMLLRDLSNNIKIKIIKNDKNIHNKFLMSEKHFSKTRFLMGVIISLFEKLNSNGFNTIFMNKVEIIDYCYNFFIGLLKNILDNYLETNTDKRKNLKPMINNIFVDKGNYYSINRLYLIMNDIIFNFNISCKNKENHDLFKKHLDRLLIIIQNDITEFINKTLYDLVDLFYFKFIREIYVENDKNNKYVINSIILMIEKINKKLDEKKIDRIIEINCKNILILLYKIIFFINKKEVILYSENDLLVKNIILFISKFMDTCNILYTKILFPIEEVNPKNSKRKLLIEIIFEIIFEMHLDNIRYPNLKILQASEFLLSGLFDEKNIQTSSLGNIKMIKSSKIKNNEKHETRSPFYIMDKIGYYNINNNNKENTKISEDISINKQFYELRDYLLSKYKDDYNFEKNLFSVCIIFAIKLILSIKEINDIYSKKKAKKTDNKIENINPIENQDKNINKLKSKDFFQNVLIKQFINICKNIIKIHTQHTSQNPFKSIGTHSNNLYESFRSFIVDKLSFVEGDSNTKIQELINILEDNQKLLKIYSRVIYTQEGRVRLYNEKTYNQIISNKKNELNSAKDNDSISSTFDKRSKHSNEDKNSIIFNSSFKGSFNSANILPKSSKFNFNSKSTSQISAKNIVLINLNNIDNNDDKILYISTIQFEKDLIKKYFSFYFLKLLSYDEDFINIKKIYNIEYNKEIEDINKYDISYPIKFKNYITNNYMRVFLKRDFNFFSDGYFIYSHKYLFNKEGRHNYEIQNKLLFPLKSLINEFDNANKDKFLNLEKLIIYECEMLTAKGSIFGNIFVFDNCLLFKSDLKNDKRKRKKFNQKDDNNKDKKEEEINYLNYACCSNEYDHLKIYKKIIIEFKDIKEVINRTFFYSWISLEIFLKNGKSYLFNFFNEDTNNDVLDFLKGQKVPVIRKVSEYFKKEDFSKKWKEGKISTFDYLLILNKMSSRTFNDTNQYLIMPWLFLKDGIDCIRNFDLPISVQDKDKQELYLSNNSNYAFNETSPTHGNHYSTSAYIFFYLMRINPFTNNMIKFQSNNFDIPERQYTDIKQTIFLCQRMNNNREIIPELYTIPEIYMNLNYNDFGKQKEGLRIHNITFEPYSKNPIEFCYLLKNLVNNNPTINNNINQWFDFIFGINQIGNNISNKSSIQNKKDLQLLRKFNSYCYGQYYNKNKIFLEAKKNNKNDKDLLQDIYSTLSISYSFGQCPFQILSDIHPSKYIQVEKEEINNKEISYTFDDNFNINLINQTTDNKNKDFENNFNNNNISYFSKKMTDKYFYCLYDNMNLEIYKINNKVKNEYVLNQRISPQSQFLLFKSAKNGNLIINPKYVFCKLGENSFIFCRTLDKTLKYFKENNETSFLLNSYTTCIKKINDNEFITGHDNGKICKWRIEYSNEDNKVELNLLLINKSNKNLIKCLIYNEKLNIIISSDNDTLILRKNYDFEYINSIKIKNEEKLKKYLIDIKISDYDIIYVHLYIEDIDAYELQGFTLNGTYIGKYISNISNFEITKTGKIIVGEKNKSILKILDPINFNEIYHKDINISGKNFFHFHFEEPNIIYYGYRDNNYSRIKIFYLEKSEEKYFL